MPKKESINRVQEQARKQVRDLNGFDYNAPAELFPTPSKTHTGNLRYKRFDTAAEALRFAVEEIPAPALRAPSLKSMRRVSERKKFATCMKMLPIR
jgi:hypothetical protein